MSIVSKTPNLTATIRALALRPEERLPFIAENIRQAKELQRKNLQEYENAISSFLLCLESFDVVGGLELDIMCALTALDILLKLELTTIQIAQCNSYVRLCLLAVNHTSLATAAAQTFGRTLVFTISSDFVRDQVDEALSWMGLTDVPMKARRICGILLLCDVALHVPMLILPKIDVIFAQAWGCLSSQDQSIRDASLKLFKVSGKLLSSRAPASRGKSNDTLLHQLKTNLAAKSRESNIAGLLAFETVVMCSIGSSSQPRYEDVSIMLVPYFMTGGPTNSSEVVRELLFRCLVVLCRYSTTLFITNQLKHTVSFALGSIRKFFQHCAAFEMISEIISMVGKNAFGPFVTETCNAIRFVFEKSKSPCWESLKCFSVICRECPPLDVENYVDSCIENVFHWGLSSQLIECMRNIISSSSAKYRTRLEEALLDMISVTLCGLPFRQHLGFMSRITANPESEATEGQIVVALDALMQFGFSNSELMGDFLRDSILPLIDGSSAAVRNAAIRTIVTLLIPSGAKGELTIARRICVDTIVSRMLIVGLSHPDPQVRQIVLSSFTTPFYPYLSEIQFLTQFYAALSDECIECRIAVTGLFCRMIGHDPSHILPIFRKEMMRILHAVSGEADVATHHHGLLLLDVVATNAPQFVVNFIDGIRKALEPHFASLDPHSPILQPLLRCGTAVARAAYLFDRAGPIFTPEVKQVCDLLDSLPLDSTYTTTRSLCVRFLSATLGPQIGGQSPYEVYPQLYRQLAGILKNSDDNLEVRLEALHCVGTIGALDASFFQSVNLKQRETQSKQEPYAPSVLSHAMCCRHVLRCIASLLDRSEKSFSGSRESLLRVCVQTILNIGERCPCSRPEMAVILLPVVRATTDLGEGRLLCTVLYEMAHIFKYVGPSAILSQVNIIHSFFHRVWNQSNTNRFLIVRLTSAIADYNLHGHSEYRRCNANFLPMMINALNDVDSTEYLKYTILGTILKHAGLLTPCTDVVVNNLLSASMNMKNGLEFVLSVVTSLKAVCLNLFVEELAGVIVRGLLNCLKLRVSIITRSVDKISLTSHIMGVFCVLAARLQGEFLKYSTEIIRTLKALRVSNAEFSRLHGLLANDLCCVLSDAFCQEYYDQFQRLFRKCESMTSLGINRNGEVWGMTFNAEDSGGSVGALNDDEKPLPISAQCIINNTKTVPLTKEEWFKWLDHFSLCILQGSPYRVFRCVSFPIGTNAVHLVEHSPQFTHEIMQLAFRALWSFGTTSVCSSIADFMRQTLRQPVHFSSTVPDEVITVLLSLTEYMDIVGLTLPISRSDLFECAWRRGMLAKALYWCEAAYREDPSTASESLITLYIELHQIDSAIGILNEVNDEQKRSLLQRSGLLKLAGHAEMLQLTQQEINKVGDSENSGESLVRPLPYRGRAFHRVRHPLSEVNGSLPGEEAALEAHLEGEIRRMLTLTELGDYDKVLKDWKNIFQRHNAMEVDSKEGNILYYISQYAADASIRLQEWSTLEETLRWLPQDTVECQIANASLHIHKENYDSASAAVIEGRKILLEDLSGLLHESYLRAYGSLVVAQVLSELEEIIIAKRAEKETGSTHHIQRISRLWDQRLEMMSPTVPAWKQVLGVRGLLRPPMKDVATRLRFVKLCRREKAKKHEQFTLNQLLGHDSPSFDQLMNRSVDPRLLLQYISFLSSNGVLGPGTTYGLESDLLKKMIDTHTKAENSILISRAYARLGTMADVVEAVECYKAATLYDPKWFHAWQMWAETNAELLNREFSDTACSNAILGYIQSINLGSSDSTIIQDVLKLLTFLSRHCDHENGLKELRKRVLDVSPRVWHLVLPQLIARLDSGSDGSCQLVVDILSAVALEYPVSLIYPLNLCAMSDSDRRKRGANEILEKLEGKYPIIVCQGRILIDELLRIADLLHEQWHAQFEASASAFFGRRNYTEMVKILLPLHEKLHRAPETIVEAEFASRYSRTLDEAHEWVRSYLVSGCVSDLHSAWNIYRRVYSQLEDQIKSQKRLHMQFCSPKLFEARNLSVGIPDAMPGEQGFVSNISSFDDILVVIPSQQRPKRLSVITKEGHRHKYLLKGHEDLRLDERVMQLFRLVNTLLISDSRTCKNSGFQIQRYSVTPLKDTVGIIGWVSGCDTLHELVYKYRKFRNIPCALEAHMLSHIISVEHANAYDHLTIQSKVEVMEFLADHTSGHDIRKAMWSSAASCETWLEQRQVFTTSLATTSVVGYILGLGDRHPQNMMVQRTSGLVVHIDFGDCFEVAVTRDRFPEKVPFRLTRMLRNALDVSGVNGSYRTTAETAMWVLRDGSHSVLAILEAFIQDPLISWRLVNRPGQEPKASADVKTIEEHLHAMRLQPHVAHADATRDFGVSTEATYCENALSMREEVDMVHKGVTIFHRVRSKLRGEEFMQTGGESMDPRVQVARLILEATIITNVAQSWSGWYPYW